jgi:hypothetical protein
MTTIGSMLALVIAVIANSQCFPLTQGRKTPWNGTPAKFLGFVEAPDGKAAIEAAAREFKVADALRDPIVARRDD